MGRESYETAISHGLIKIDENYMVRLTPVGSTMRELQASANGVKLLSENIPVGGSRQPLVEVVDDFQVGDKVVVADSGEPLEATVQSKGSDGKYKLSFGSKKPVVDRGYAKEEIKKKDTNSNPSTTTTNLTPLTTPVK
jgi:hypothetical protein